MWDPGTSEIIGGARSTTSYTQRRSAQVQIRYRTTDLTLDNSDWSPTTTAQRNPFSPTTVPNKIDIKQYVNNPTPSVGVGQVNIYVGYNLAPASRDFNYRYRIGSAAWTTGRAVWHDGILQITGLPSGQPLEMQLQATPQTSLTHFINSDWSAIIRVTPE